MSDDIRICEGPTCREAIRFVKVEGASVPVNASPDSSGSIVVFGKDSGIRMTSDQRATLVGQRNVYKEHECSDQVYLRLKRIERFEARRYQRRSTSQQRYAGARR